MQIDRGVLTAVAGALFGVGGVVAADAFTVVDPSWLPSTDR